TLVSLGSAATPPGKVSSTCPMATPPSGAGEVPASGFAVVAPSGRGIVMPASGATLAASGWPAPMPGGTASAESDCEQAAMVDETAQQTANVRAIRFIGESPFLLRGKDQIDVGDQRRIVLRHVDGHELERVVAGDQVADGDIDHLAELALRVRSRQLTELAVGERSVMPGFPVEPITQDERARGVAPLVQVPGGHREPRRLDASHVDAREMQGVRGALGIVGHAVAYVLDRALAVPGVLAVGERVGHFV